MNKTKKNDPITKVFVGCLLLVIILSIALVIFTLWKGNVINLPFLSTYQAPSDLPLVMEVTGGLKMNYSSNWSVTNNGTDGVELDKGDISIIINTAKVENSSTLSDIVDERLKTLTANKKLDSRQVVKINSREFEKITISNIDETLFPSDGFTLYATLTDSNIYVTIAVTYPPNVSPNDALKLINTVR